MKIDHHILSHLFLQIITENTSNLLVLALVCVQHQVIICIVVCSLNHHSILLVYQHKSRTLVQNSLTTPSASKSVRRCRNQMTEELFQLFNKTIFNNNVSSTMDTIVQWSIG